MSIQKELLKIGKSIPRDLLKKSIVQTKPFSFEENLVHTVINDKSFDSKKRQWLDRMKDQPDIIKNRNRVTTEIDDKVAVKINDFVTTKVRRAISNGTLPKPKANDPFFNYVKDNYARK